MKTKEEILEEKIKEKNAYSIDPFEVFERMKLAAYDAMEEYKNQKTD